jgi:hypothetical protein
VFYGINLPHMEGNIRKTGPGVGKVPGLDKGEHANEKRHTPEQVINKLREAEVAMSGGSTVVLRPSTCT